MVARDAPLRVSLSDRFYSQVEKLARHRDAAFCDEVADMLLEPPVSFHDQCLAQSWRRVANQKRAADAKRAGGNR